MKSNAISGRIITFFKSIYIRLFAIDDTPQKIAAGFGMGVFFGVMPAMGGLVAFFFAIIFKVNRASALLGGVLTNTWLSIPVFFLSARIGAAITGASYENIRAGWVGLLKNFKWAGLFKLSVFDIIAPVIIGYIAVSLIMGMLAYGAALIALKYGRRHKGI